MMANIFIVQIIFLLLLYTFFGVFFLVRSAQIKKLILSLIIFLGLIACAFAYKHFWQLSRLRAKATAEIFIVAGPGIEYHTLHKLAVGDRVEVITEQDSWYHIKGPNNIEGWATKDNLQTLRA